MSNWVSRMFHSIGDACDCGASPEEMEMMIKEIESQRNVDSIRDDLRRMKELIGFLGKRIECLEEIQDKPKEKAKIIPLNKK